MIEATRYQPGTPEFEEIAKQVTPIQRVKNYSQRTTYIQADVIGSKHAYRRQESVNKARG